MGLVVTHLLACPPAGELVNPRVYDFLDRHSDQPELSRLRGQLFLLEDGYYAAPEGVFLKDHGLGRFARQLSGDSIPYKKLLARLDVRDLPEAEDAVRVLEQLDRDFGAGNRELTDLKDRDVAWYCWKLLESAEEAVLEEIAGKESHPQRSEHPATPETLLLNDRPTLAPAASPSTCSMISSPGARTFAGLVTAGVRSERPT